MQRVRLACWVLALFAAILLGGCAWESGGNGDDAGTDANTTDQDRSYPPPPYGTGYMDTVENFSVDQCLCPADGSGQGKPIKMDRFLDAKATMVTVHAGWCTYCKQQSETMERDIYQTYKDQGLDILLVLFQDDNGNSGRQNLLDYCCEYKEHYGLTFTLAIDPDAEVMDQFFRPDEAGTPLNMLLDQRMRIRFKLEGLLPVAIEGNIEGLLSED